MASTTTGTVVGYFATEAQAEGAVSALKDAGFTSSQIGIAVSGPDAAGSGVTGASYERTGTGTSTTAGQAGHQAGQAVGNAWERFKNFFDGGSDGDIEPYADERARGSNESHEITAGGYYHDDLPGTLGSMNVPANRSQYFGQKLGTGTGAVVTVSAAGREDEAEAILTRAGGDVGADAVGSDYTTSSAATSGYAAGATDLTTSETTGTAAEQRRIQLLGEVLRVHKDRVSRGEVRIRKEIITEQQTVQVPVTREELVIERVPTTGQTAAAGTIGAESEIRIPLSEEVASADTQTVVREEIAIGKKAVQNVQEVGGSVRHEELEIEDETSTTPRTTGGTL